MKGVDKAQLDFEISFYERLIKDKPNFIQALICLADAYTKRGLYREGLKIDKKLVKLKFQDPLCHYNLACSYSLLGMKNKAFETLEKAVKLGYRDVRFMEKDPDLDNLKGDSRYKKIVSAIAQRAIEKKVK